MRTAGGRGLALSRRLPCWMSVCVLVLASAASTPAPPRQAREEARAGFRLWDAEDYKPAGERFERALALALADGDRVTEAEARRGRGLVLLNAARYAEATAELERALDIFQALGDRPGVARVYSHLAAAARPDDSEQARTLFGKALAGFQEVGDREGEAQTLRGLSELAALPKDRQELLARALEIARALGDKIVLGNVIHWRGDDRFQQGDFAGALECYEDATVLLEAAGARASLAAVYTSLGRLNRAHGAAERALEFHERALRLREEVVDQAGIIQSLNAIAVALDATGRGKEALGYYERALALARETGASLLISRQLGNLGGAYVLAGDYERGAAILQEVLRRGPDPWTGMRHQQISTAYLNLKQFERALQHTEEAVRLARNDGRPESLFFGLWNRAEAKEGLGRSEEALADAREALDAIEQLRARLVPSDFMKRGFGDKHQDVYDFLIVLLQKHGRDAEALEAAERARARAFLDLLAARHSRRNSPESPGPSVPPATPGPPGLAARGAPPSSGEAERRGDPSSPVAASAASLPEMVATARRLRSTILSYFVDSEATLVWVVDPSGQVSSARVEAGAGRLEALVRSTLAPTMVGETRGPGTADAPGSPRAAAPIDLPTRGGGLLVLGGAPPEAWGELYDLLIRPVRGHLPASEGSRLTIVPHGPLFQLSFAALRDERGRYLIEKHAVHYAPSAGVLGFTAKRARAVPAESSYPLLVADPDTGPAAADTRPLPPLPGARREVEAVSKLLPRRGIVRLVGPEATRAEVRRLAPEASLLHLATHGIVLDEKPLESFLALGAGSSPEIQDSRLTVQDIYDLDLRSRLVVLSGCRTARGRISADGIIGLTRAFIYAGAPSVVATLWDVADEPTFRLIAEFYRRLAGDPDKGQALRAGQLALIRSLRAGQVKLPAPGGEVALPEDPALWAGFILVGEP